MESHHRNNLGHTNKAFQEDDQHQDTPDELQVSDETGDHQLGDCSLFSVKLKWLNNFRNPKWFLVFLSTAAFLQGLCINGFVNVVITSIERRFGLKSTQSGMIASTYDIGSLLIMIPVSFLGGRTVSSKPRWIGVGLMCQALGSLMWTIPHFATPVYDRTSAASVVEESAPSSVRSNICIPGTNTSRDDLGDASDDDQWTSSLSNYRYVFILGQLLHGFGAAPLVTLGTTFLDDIVKTGNSPFYIGIFYAWFIIGPAVGYILGGKLLSFHTDFLTDSGLTPGSPLWVGAWWPGFLITFLGSLVCGLVILCYPRNISKYQSNTGDDSSDSLIRSLVASLRATLLNPLFISVSLALASDGFIVSGLAAFLPKYVQTGFHVSAGGAAQLVGLVSVAAGAGAILLGGWLVKRLGLTRTRMLLLCSLAQLINIPLCIIFINTCHNLQYVGLTSGKVPPLTEVACNSECGCDQYDLDPVCGSDNLMYLSPCLAGCLNTGLGNNFTDCSCVDDSVKVVQRSLCDADCNKLSLFIVISFLSMFFTFIISIPTNASTLRSVPPQHRSMALGIQTIVARIIGGIPGPILFGLFIDNTCKLWQQDSSSDASNGSCLVYDNKDFAVFMTGVTIFCKALSMIFYIVSYFASTRSNIQDVPEEENKAKS